MRIFIHRGNGHYVGSVVIVSAETITDAAEIIEKYLIDNGLSNEALNIEEIEIKDTSIIYAQNGDY